MLVFGEVVTGHDDDAHDAAPIGTSEMQMKSPSMVACVCAAMFG